jgi:DNA/RNA endonuclease YhcR with UshA esterase domain
MFEVLYLTYMKYIKLSVILFISFLSTRSIAQTTIAAKDAAKHLNEKVIVCDEIFGGKYLSGADITLIDVGGSHPNELLTLVIKGDDRKKFKTPPEEAFKEKKVCITGQVIDYKGKPEIIITDPEQIKENTK